MNFGQILPDNYIEVQQALQAQIACRDGFRVAYLGKTEVNGRVEKVFSFWPTNEKA